MLDPQIAQEHLREAATAHPLPVQIDRVRELPPALRAAAFSLLGCDLDGKPFTSYRTSPGRVEAQAEAAALCDAISVSERELLFSAFFPQLGRAIARWWSPEISPLHHVGWNPRPFRLLHDNEASRPARLQQLQSLLSDSPHFGIGRYCEQGPIWFATYAPYLGSENSRALIGDRIGAILSTAIDRSDPSEGNAIQDILISSARGDHPVGAMGRHVLRAFLSSSRPEGWKYVASLLSEQGENSTVRRQILEVAGEAHPQAFVKILEVIREKSLLRFPDVIHTVIGWLGVEEEGFSVSEGNGTLARIETFLRDTAIREKAIVQSLDGATLYYALWSTAFLDVRQAITIATRLLSDTHVERRFAATYLLSQTRLPEAEHSLLNALNDPDIRIAAFAFRTADWSAYRPHAEPGTEISGSFPAVIPAISESERKDREREGGLLGALRGFVAKIGRKQPLPDKGLDGIPELHSANVYQAYHAMDRFDRVTRNLPRFPAKEKQLDPLIWGWTRHAAAQFHLADVLPVLMEDRPLSCLYPFLPMMSATGRWQLSEVLAGKRPRTTEGTNLLITLLADGAPTVRQRAADVLKRFPLGETETIRLEDILARKQPADMQRAVTALLLGRPDGAVLETAGRFLATSEDDLRAVGLSVLVHMTEKNRAVEYVRDIVDGWLIGMEPAAISDAEMVPLKQLLTPRRIVALKAACSGK